MTLAVGGHGQWKITMEQTQLYELWLSLYTYIYIYIICMYIYVHVEPVREDPLDAPVGRRARRPVHAADHGRAVLLHLF